MRPGSCVQYVCVKKERLGGMLQGYQYIYIYIYTHILRALSCQRWCTKQMMAMSVVVCDYASIATGLAL